jgi:ubiquitin-conjugating enzyme E2 O
VGVLWPDGTSTIDDSRAFEPVGEIIDEHDVWPGDVCMYTGGDQERIAIVQKADWETRIGQVRWYSTEEVDQVSLLELDPTGPPPDVYGVRRGGAFAFVSRFFGRYEQVAENRNTNLV